MSKRTIKDIVFLDRFVKKWACSAKNHPKGWAWWKRKNRKDTRLKLKGELRDVALDAYNWNSKSFAHGKNSTREKIYS